MHNDANTRPRNGTRPPRLIPFGPAARNLSARRGDRAAGQAAFGPGPRPVAAGALPPDRLERALIAGKRVILMPGWHRFASIVLLPSS